MRGEKIDGELRLVATLLHCARQHGESTPTNQRTNDLLDEWLRVDARYEHPSVNASSSHECVVHYA